MFLSLLSISGILGNPINHSMVQISPSNKVTSTEVENTKMEITWRVISGKGGKNGGKGTGNNKHKWQVQNRQGEVKNSMGNGEAKDLICTTHGHELRGLVMWVGVGVQGRWK